MTTEVKRSIHKFEIDLRVLRQTIVVPGFWKLLDIQMQDGKCMLWAAVMDSEPASSLQVDVVPTGGGIPVDISMVSYQRTVQEQILVGSLVWHIFVHARPA
jgi:hypothetical protein